MLYNLKLTTLLLFVATACIAQEMPINGADITQCGGFLVDDGFSSSNYSNNQNQTITICALAPETIVNLYFTVSAMGDGDYIEIFDGPTNAAPLIGTYYGTDLQTTDITSTNPNGCLTVHFVSDGTVTGNFGAEISCGPPCERPFSNINTNQNPYPVLLCPGEEITFDGSSSTFAAGASLQSFEWIFEDGTTNTTSWPTVTHAFAEPGAYEVQLMLTDNNDCTNNNLTDYVILVSTYPDFSLLSPNFELCQGGLEYLGVNYFIPDSIFGNDSLSSWIDVPYIPIPDVDFGGALYIPDDQSMCFSSELLFSGFDNGAVIQQASDLDYFFINFEHSFMGDLTVTFICPNGQSIAVHQQGGGGTYLGVPIDDESGAPGVGWDYYWAPDATNGTWAAESGGTLPAGTYQSVQPWSSIVGCPLNGTWTVEVCDMWGADDGYIFDWSMSFDPSYYGDLWAFTPVYGADCDSSYWTGPFIIQQDDNCDFIAVEIGTTGSYDYTYTVTNNFGCTFDTTITVNVFVASEITAGPDLIFSCDPVQLQGGIDISLTPDCDNAVGDYSVCFSNNQTWMQTYCPDQIGDGVTYISIDVISGELDNAGDVMYVYDGSSTGAPLLAGPISGNLSSYFFTAGNAEGCLTFLVEMNGSLSCQSGDLDPFIFEVICGENNIPYIWNWTPALGLSNAQISTPWINTLNGDTEFILTGYPTGYPGCGDSDTVMVSINTNLPNAGQDATISICAGTDPFNMIDALSGSPTPGGTWYNSANAVVSEVFDSNTDVTGVYKYEVVQDACVFNSFLTVEINAPGIFVGNDTLICIGGTAQLHAWSDPFNQNSVGFVWTNGDNGADIIVTPASNEVIGVYATDGNSCISDTAYVTITLRNPLNVIAENDSVICPFAMALAEVDASSGGLAPYSYTWSANGSPLGNSMDQSYSMSDIEVEFCVTISDACETPSAQDCMLVSVPPVIDVAIDPLYQAGCFPYTALFTIATDPDTYTASAWEFSNGATADGETTLNVLFSTPGFYDAQLTLNNEYGCTYTEIFENVVQVYPGPIAAWTASPQITDIKNTDIQFTNYSQGIDLVYHWDFGAEGNADTSNLENPLFHYTEQRGALYEVLLHVKDIYGCYNNVRGYIDVNDLFNVWIPNAFTPNNDLVNDQIFVFGTDISAEDFEWIIFNRWGEVVFRSIDPNVPWTGNMGNGEYYAENGVYNYILKVRSATHVEEEIIKGSITLTR
jgi:gliding motility-associated-like protein